MCGIVGIIDFSNQSIDPSVLVSMRDRMSHRGPDDYGVVLLNSKPVSHKNRGEKAFVQFRDLNEIESNFLQFGSYPIGLAHRRLSIIDLTEAGRQPMCNEDASIWIIFNGEIYNFMEIRSELENHGHYFRSRTDTEVIVHAYEQWGMNCLERFIGMFAFAIWDSRRKELILVRDRMGIKPLYYTFIEKKLLFASEIKAILEYPAIVRQVNEESFYHYLSFHCVPSPETLFKGIFKVEAGHYLVIQGLGETRSIPYWDMFRRRNDQSLNRSEEDVCQEILDLFRDATRLQMISDVPFGAFLSGGIDSSLNVAVMSQILNQPVNTFTVGFEKAPEFNELHWARKIAELFNTKHHEVIISAQDTISFLSDLIYFQDEPIADSVCVPVYFVSKLAKECGVSVCQVGEGSDELFCGYPSWLEILEEYNQKKSLSAKIMKLPMLFISYLASHIGGVGWGTYEHYFNFFNNAEIFWGGAVAYRDLQKKVLLSETVLKTCNHPTRELISRYREHFEDHCYKPDPLSWLTYLDLCIRLPELLLMRLDKMNMAVSLEGRVPFLDHRLVELLMSLSQDLKIRGEEAKYLLKKEALGILPNSIIDRPKQGFQLPVDKWYEDHFHEPFQNILERFLKETDYFNPKPLKKLTDRKGVPWIIINFILWHQAWIEGAVGSGK